MRIPTLFVYGNRKKENLYFDLGGIKVLMTSDKIKIVSVSSTNKTLLLLFETLA